MNTYREKPLAEGRSPEISAKLLVDERVTVERAVEILISPAVPASCVIKRVPRTIKTTIKVGVESYGCALTPWRWGKCWKDVFREVDQTVFDDVKECVEEQIAKYKTMMQPVIEIKEAVFPTSMWIDHDLLLRDLKITAQGKRLDIVGDLRLEVALDVKQGVLGANMTIKGALKCDTDLTLKAGAEVEITPEASLKVVLKDLDLDWRKACVPGAVEAIDIALLTNPVLLAQSKIIGELLNKILVSELNKVIRKSTEDDLNFRDDLLALAPKIRQPVAVGDDLWLEIRPKQIFISQLRSGGSGADNALIVDAGFIATPQLTYGKKPQDQPGGEIPFAIGQGPASFEIAARGGVSLRDAQTRVADELRGVVDQKFANQPYTVGTVELYQSGERLVVGVEFVKRSSKKRAGIAYVWTRPRLLEDGQTIAFEQAEVDVETKNKLAKAAAWLLDGEIERRIGALRLDVGGPLRKLHEQNRSFSADVGIGTIVGTIAAVEPKGVWLADGSLNVWALAKGTAQIEVRAPNVTR
jgi:hypothetical protein